MASTPSIMLVHGAWHTPAHYDKLISTLKAAGLVVHCPALPSMNGARPPTADLASDTDVIRREVENLADSGRTIIAVMHSYGGQVGTNALVGLSTTARAKSGKPGGVSRLIYVCAFALPEGGSMSGKVHEMGNGDLLPLAFGFADDGTVVSRDPKTLILGPGLDDAETEKYVGNFALWNGKSMHQGISHCAWREMPVTYIQTTQDMTVPLHYQQDMVEKLRAAGTSVDTFEVATGHCPNATATAEVAEVIKKKALA